MPKITTALVVVIALLLFKVMDSADATQGAKSERRQKVDLGAFSISLTVKDLAVSRTFYEKLGFAIIGGKEAHNYLILRNGQATIGLFQGMFDKNIMTFNPGWVKGYDHPEKFMDIREIQRRLKRAGLKLKTEVDESTNGPASLTLIDPDGNPILLDQHR